MFFKVRSSCYVPMLCVLFSFFLFGTCANGQVVGDGSGVGPSQALINPHPTVVRIVKTPGTGSLFITIRGGGATPNGTLSVVIRSPHTPPLHQTFAGFIVADANGNFRTEIPFPPGGFNGSTEEIAVLDDKTGNSSTSVWAISPNGVGHLISSDAI